MKSMILPVLLIAGGASAQDCQNIPYSQRNCVRALACIGDQGLWFDGEARGWDQGRIDGEMNDGTACSGEWTSGGFMGTGNARLTCEDGTEIGIVYYTQDSVTGTVSGRGVDNRGRGIRGWSGLNVLEFLRDGPDSTPSLPCSDAPIPLV